MDLSRAIHDHLARAAASLTASDEPPQSVRVEPVDTIFQAIVTCAGVEHRFAVKPIPPAQHVDRPSRLRDIQLTLRRHSSSLRDALIPICDVSDSDRFIVMPWTAGPTLEALMHTALRRRGDFDGRITACLDRTARILAELHELRASTFHLSPVEHHNREYLPSLDQYWRHDLIRRAAPAGISGPELLDRVCTPDFRNRLGDRLLPADVQPKNQIIHDDNAVTFVDPDFNAGNPAMTLVGFMLGLDRLALRHPTARAFAQIDAWKRYLLHAYSACGESWVVDDVRVLYPWALVRTFDQHAEARPLYRPYLIHVYTRVLRLYLHHLADTLTSVPARALAA